MLNTQRFVPSDPLLRSAVEYFQLVEVVGPATIRSIPNARIDAWVTLEGCFDIQYEPEGPFYAAPQTGFLPLFNKALLFSIPGRLRVINFKCYPHILSGATLAPLSAVSRILDFGQLFSEPVCWALWQALAEQAPDRVIMQTLEGLLLKGLFAGGLPSEWLHRVMLSLETSGTFPQVDRMAADAFVSVKTLERRFRYWTGLNPKDMYKLVRFQQAVKAIRENQRGRSRLSGFWDAGYYDHSHFVKECQALTGMPPSRLLTRLTAPFTDLIVLQAV